MITVPSTDVRHFCPKIVLIHPFDSSMNTKERREVSLYLFHSNELYSFCLPYACFSSAKKRDLKMRMMKSEQITSKFNNTKVQFILNKTFTWKEENMHRKLLINDSNSIRWSNWISFQNSNWISSTRIHFNCISTFPVHHNLFIKPFDYDITE